jgi:hypothetical protein
MAFELACAAWETIARRTLLMASGQCSPEEYRRMVSEKVAAAHRTARLLSRSPATLDLALLMAPWHGRATSNARRLRKR